MRRARLTLAGLLVLPALAVTGPAALAAAPIGTANPATVPNDATKTIVVTAQDAAFYPANQESVVLHPQSGATADLPTDVSNASSCGLGLPDSDCGDSLSLSVDTTNAAPGAYDVIETGTPVFGGDARTRTIAVVTVQSKPYFAAMSPLAPANGGRGARSLGVTITGRGFAAGLTAAFGPGTTVTETRVNSATSALASVQIAGDAPLGAHDVTLTSADGLTATATGAFTVNPGPTLTGITPASVLRGGTADVTIAGRDFVPGDGSALTIAGTDVNNVQVTATEIKATVTTSASTANGPRAVRFRNPDGGESALDGAFAVISPPGAVGDLAAAVGDGIANVSWTAPADPGSSAVTAYVVTGTPAAGAAVTQTVTSTTASLKDLVNGQAYTFSVVARNAVGDGPAATTTGTPRFATSLVVTSVSTATAGQDYVVRGSLIRAKTAAPASGATVTLTFTPQVGKPFVRNVTTGTDGRFASTVRATYTLKVEAAFAGRTEDAPSSSQSATTFVKARVSVVSPKSGAVSAASTVITVVGSVSPNKAGKPVGLYDGTRLVSRAVVATNGSFRINVKLARGDHRLFVNINATSGNLGGRSASFVVRRT